VCHASPQFFLFLSVPPFFFRASFESASLHFLPGCCLLFSDLPSLLSWLGLLLLLFLCHISPLPPTSWQRPLLPNRCMHQITVHSERFPLISGVPVLTTLWLWLLLPSRCDCRIVPASPCFASHFLSSPQLRRILQC